MLFIVSEPTLLMLPDTPLVRWYAGSAGSILNACAITAVVAASAIAVPTSARFITVPPRCRPEGLRYESVSKDELQLRSDFPRLYRRRGWAGLNVHPSDVALPLQAVPRVVVVEGAACFPRVVARRNVGRVERAVARRDFVAPPAEQLPGLDEAAGLFEPRARLRLPPRERIHAVRRKAPELVDAVDGHRVVALVVARGGGKV